MQPMLAQMQAQRLWPISSFAGPHACLQRSAPAQPLHLSSSRQTSESQLRPKFYSASVSRRHQTLVVNAQSSNGAVARPWADKNARLVLEDGSVWEGRAFGAKGTAIAETVFNTSLTGYQEILTDPSYKGQYVVFTHPHIGNVGINFGEQAQLLHQYIQLQDILPPLRKSDFNWAHTLCYAKRVDENACFHMLGHNVGTRCLSSYTATILHPHEPIIYI